MGFLFDFYDVSVCVAADVVTESRELHKRAFEFAGHGAGFDSYTILVETAASFGKGVRRIVPAELTMARDPDDSEALIRVAGLMD